MKLGFVQEGSITQGSAYKYIEMFKKVATIVPMIAPDIYNLKDNLNGVIIMGDRVDTYEMPIALDIPYILIANDVHSLRSGESLVEERRMMENASGIIFPAKVMYEYCNQLYRLPHSEIIQLKPLKKDIDFIPKEKLSNKDIVYSGNYLTREFEKTPWGHRFILPILEIFIAAGYTVHLYPSVDRSRANEKYIRIGCVPHKTVSNENLYQELSQYHFGLQIFYKTSMQSAINYARTVEPNKIWEYLGAGIPTLGINAGYSASFYDGKWGYNLETDNLTVEDIVNIVKKLDTLNITEELRFSQIIDNDVIKFKRLLFYFKMIQER